MQTHYGLFPDTTYASRLKVSGSRSAKASSRLIFDPQHQNEQVSYVHNNATNAEDEVITLTPDPVIYVDATAGDDPNFAPIQDATRESVISNWPSTLQVTFVDNGNGAATAVEVFGRSCDDAEWGLIATVTPEPGCSSLIFEVPTICQVKTLGDNDGYQAFDTRRNV